MDYLNSFLSLLNISKVDEYDDRLELTFLSGPAKHLEINLTFLMEKDVIGLFTDGGLIENWDDLNILGDESECHINLNKSNFIEIIIQVSSNAQQFVFFSIEYFNNWVSKNSNPFLATHPLNEKEKNLLWVNELLSEQLGSRLSIVPLGKELENYFVPLDASLPGDEEIKSHVHPVTRDPVLIDPETFKLPDVAFKISEIKPFFLFYVQSLAACLVKEFYSINNVVVSGIKRISLKLSSCNADELSLEDISVLEQTVRWVYGERTETRLILLMDRVSLDLPEGDAIIPSIFKNLKQALEQAKYRYEFVIKDRQEAHAKELAELQKDLKSATDGYSKSVNTIVSGLLRDALSSVFILTIGIFSKLIGQQEIVELKQSNYLFKGLAVYLLISLVLRLGVNLRRLQLSLNDIQYWKNTTRNHMAETELKMHIDTCTKPYKRFFFISASLIVLIYLALSYFVWEFPSIINGSPLAVSEFFDHFQEWWKGF